MGVSRIGTAGPRPEIEMINCLAGSAVQPLPYFKSIILNKILCTFHDIDVESIKCILGSFKSSTRDTLRVGKALNCLSSVRSFSDIFNCQHSILNAVDDKYTSASYHFHQTISYN